MKERIFNLYKFVEGGFIREIGVTVRECSGNDNSKMKQLQSKANEDVAHCLRFAVPSRFVVVDASGLMEAGVLTDQTANDLALMNRELELFEELFESVGAPRDPMVCITPVVDGVIPRIDAVRKTSYSLALESGLLPHGTNPRPSK